MKSKFFLLFCAFFAFAFVSCSNDELTDEDTEMTLKISFSNFEIKGGSVAVTYGCNEKTSTANAKVADDGKSAEATLLREYCDSNDKITKISYLIKDSDGNEITLNQNFATSFKFKKKSKSVTLSKKSDSSSSSSQSSGAGEEASGTMTLTVKFYLCDSNEYFYENDTADWEEADYTSLHKNKGETLILTYGSESKGTQKIEKIIGENSESEIVPSLELELDSKYSSEGIFDKISVSSIWINPEDSDDKEEYAVFACPPKISYSKDGATLYVIYEKNDNEECYISNGKFNYIDYPTYSDYSGYDDELGSILISKEEGVSEKYTISGFKAHETNDNGRKGHDYRFEISGDGLTDNEWFAISLDGSKDEEKYFELNQGFSSEGIYYFLYTQSDFDAFSVTYEKNGATYLDNTKSQDKVNEFVDSIAENGFYLYSSAVENATLKCNHNEYGLSSMGE